MPEIKKFFECLIPVTACNLKCDYCYVIQRDQRANDIPKLKYSPEIIGRSLIQERLGGVCYFSISGQGETFLPDYLIDIVSVILKNGHYVNITTNGTLSKRIHNLNKIPRELLKHLHISFSYHYLELKRLNLEETFFENINYVRNLGCSILVQLNLYDKYIPYLEDIKSKCIKYVGAMPQLIVTRDEESLTSDIKLMTNLSPCEYLNKGIDFESPLFSFTNKNFRVKRHEFCYAGSWTYTLNLCTGVLKRCYASTIHQNIFEYPEKPLMDLAVGNQCGSMYCLNSSHFLALGSIPELEVPTYSDLRNREEAEWESVDIKRFLSGNLKNNNIQYSSFRKMLSNFVGVADKILYKVWLIYINPYLHSVDK